MDLMKSVIFVICITCLIAVSSSQRYPGDRCTDSNRRNGVCTSLNDCPAAQEDLRRGVRPVNCGFSSRVPVVCCAVRGSPPVRATTAAPPVRATTAASTPRRVPGETADQWCSQHNRACGFGIGGGTEALPGEFPHMAAIGFGPRNNIQWKCGGSLISDKFVLTAAHCLRAGGLGPAQWILLGTVSLASNVNALGDKGQIHPVTKRIRHPGYSPPAKYHDVALLEFGPAISKNPSPLDSKDLHPACLRIKHDKKPSDASFIATGWGRTGHGEDASSQLLKVELNMFDESKCNETFDVEIRTTNQLRRGIDSSMLCAGILSGGKDTCQGDSGGPLMSTLRFDCLYEVWGITSFGKVCTFANSPAVYMRVANYIQWIEDNVWPS